MKTIHLIAGLPRSGSTLLTNILSQNPRFRVAGTSGLCDLLLNVRNCWDNIQEFRAMPPADSEAAKVRVMKGILANYHYGRLTPLNGDRPQPPVFFDKSRTWLAHLSMMEMLLDRKVKVLVPIRDVRDVLASMERLWRANAVHRQIPQEREAIFDFQTVGGRCAYWMNVKGMVGLAYARIMDAVRRGYRDRLCFVPYQAFIDDPEGILARIYGFLEEAPHYHEFDHVPATVQEDDRAYGIMGLHDHQGAVHANPPYWQEVLGEAGEPYGILNDFFKDELMLEPLPEAVP